MEVCRWEVYSKIYHFKARIEREVPIIMNVIKYVMLLRNIFKALIL